MVIYNASDLICELGIGNCSARVYETQPKTYEVEMRYKDRVLDGVNGVRESIRDIASPAPSNSTWEVLDRNGYFTVTEKDIMNLFELVDRTNQLVSSLEQGLTPTQWYESYQQTQEQTRELSQ